MAEERRGAKDAHHLAMTNHLFPYKSYTGHHHTQMVKKGWVIFTAHTVPAKKKKTAWCHGPSSLWTTATYTGTLPPWVHGQLGVVYGQWFLHVHAWTFFLLFSNRHGESLSPQMIYFSRYSMEFMDSRNRFKLFIFSS